MMSNVKIIAIECLDCSGKSTACKQLMEEYSQKGKCKLLHFPAKSPDERNYDVSTPDGYRQYQWDCLSEILTTIHSYLYPEFGPLEVEPVDYLIMDRALLSNFVYTKDQTDPSKFISLRDWLGIAEIVLDMIKMEFYDPTFTEPYPDPSLKEIMSKVENRIVSCSEIIRLQRVANKSNKDSLESFSAQEKLGRRFDSVMNTPKHTDELHVTDVFTFGPEINGMGNL